MIRQSSDPTKAKDRLFDGYLVVSAQAGDRQAAELLARRYHRRLIAHAWRLTGDMELAKDVVQSSWMDIARGLPRLKDEAAFPAWAYQIVSRRCARTIRGLQNDRALAGILADAPHDDQAEPTQIVTPRLRAAVRALPGAQRAALALFYFEDFSVGEIAVALAVPVGTVKPASCTPGAPCVLFWKEIAMSDITKALKDEEDALLRSIDEDPGHLDQISAVIAARSGWVALVLLAAQTVLFLAGAWAAWNFFKAADALVALRWGLPASVLLIASLMLKLALWPAMHAQRQLQALKRIELRILAAKGA